MIRSILWTALFVLTAQFSWGASGPVEKTLEWMAMGETASEQQMQEAGANLPELSDSERHELIVEGLKSKSRAVRYQISEMVNREPNKGKYLDILVDLAARDPDADVRRSAHGRVSSIDKQQGMALDRRLKNDPDVWVRRSALKGLLFASEIDDVRTVESALKNDHLLVRIGLTRTLMFNGKPFDKNIAIEGLTADEAWFEKNPLIPTGYMSRRTSHKQYAQYIVRVIREDAIYILGRTGAPEDIPYLERVIAREALLGDENKFGVQAQLVIWRIQLNRLPEDQQLDYLKVKLRDPRHWVQNWAVGKLCVVKGGLELIDELVKDPSHPAHNASRGQRRACLKHAPKF